MSARCEFYDIADGDDDCPSGEGQEHMDLDQMPMEYWDVPTVQLAFLEFQESRARCRRMEALYYEAKEKDAKPRATQGPGGGEAIYECFMMDSEEEPSGSGDDSGDDVYGSLGNGYNRG